MGNTKDKVGCESQPEQLESLRRWREALGGSNRELAYELMNQVMDGEITHEAALALLDSKSAEAS
ncbi:MAG: hypothetical protein WBP44_12280 [Gammaproteobacteria bacterium]|jgi:hypothetical protein